MNDPKAYSEEVALRCSVKRMFLKVSQYSQENLFLKKETTMQVFSCELCKYFKNTILTEHL